MTDDTGMEGAPTKYDSVTDALKMTEPEYRNTVNNGVDHVLESDNYTPVRPSKDEAKARTREWAKDLELFDKENFDGATYGAIVEFSDTPPHELTRWSLCGDAKSALRKMALEALVSDVVDRFMELTTKYRTDKKER